MVPEGGEGVECYLGQFSVLTVLSGLSDSSRFRRERRGRTQTSAVLKEPQMHAWMPAIHKGPSGNSRSVNVFAVPDVPALSGKVSSK